MTKKTVFLSASRIEVFKTCSALYAAKYLLKLPDPVGKAARRGSVAHDTLEILLNPRHDKVYSAVIHHGTCVGVPALWRVVRGLAKKYDVSDPDDLTQIDQFILTALRNEFKGVKGTYKAMPEKAFEIIVDKEDGRRYCVKGFMDALFFVKDETGEWLDIRDYKTGQMFRQDKLDYNVQALIYLLAARHLFPEFTRRRFRFLFVKYKSKMWQTFDATEDQLNGFEWILTEIQRYMDAFTLENALDNPLAADGGSCWLYGKECLAKHPSDYFVLVDKEGQVLSSAQTKEELKTTKEGQKIEPRHYSGCPWFYSPTGHKIR